MVPKYYEQYCRLKRWFKRFEEITMSKTHDRSSDNYQDDVYAFFMTCYHLKDWLKNDESLDISGQTIEDFVHGYDPLRICGDICNGHKHLTIDRPKIGGGAKIGGRYFSLNLGNKEALIKVRYEITVEGKVFDAFNVAKSCVEEWECFLSKNVSDFIAYQE